MINPFSYNYWRLFVHFTRFYLPKHSDDAANNLLKRFLFLRENLYHRDYYFYPEATQEQELLYTYAQREDYQFELVVGTDNRGCDRARILVGVCKYYSWPFFGFFECPNDQNWFQKLMEEAENIAREMGGSELRGPINLNPFHDWMFLLEQDAPERWIGDPYHFAYYPYLFYNSPGWEIFAQATAGILSEREHKNLMAIYSKTFQRFYQEGFRVKTMQEISLEDIYPEILDIIHKAFDCKYHHFAPITLQQLKEKTLTTLRLTDDPYSLLLVYRQGELKGFWYSLWNPIDYLCNPDGKKPTPPASERSRLKFAVNTAAFSPEIQGSSAYKALLILQSEHTFNYYGHPVAWCRTNIEHPTTSKLLKQGDITHRYVAFRKSF